MRLSGTRNSTAAGRALRAFLGTEAAGGVVLVIAAAFGLAWANSPWSDSYETAWHSGPDLRHWINDGLMALFFLVVGVEIKREIVDGDLGDRRTAALPVAAAIGGMVVPAAFFLAVTGTSGGAAARGWGIPMATDIAFALGVMALVGPRRVPSSLRVFLLTLAIVDDIGAIVVIAVFYTDDLHLRWALAGGVVALLAYALLRRAGTMLLPLFVLLGVALWFALYESGVHATLAGVAMGLLVPASHMHRIEQRLHPWTSFVVVPLFAVANTGVDLSGGGFDALTTRVGLGVLVGLVVGKPAGILLASVVATRTGLAVIPSDIRLRQLAGVAALGGIGFTVSIFVTGLAYDSLAMQNDSKVAILVASVVMSIIGGATLALSPSRRDA